MNHTEPQTISNLRPKEACKYLGVGLSTIWLYAKQGKLNPIKLSARVTLFKKDDLDRFIGMATSQETA
jgi:excisionase family DNA binding protein